MEKRELNHDRHAAMFLTDHYGDYAEVSWKISEKYLRNQEAPDTKTLYLDSAHKLRGLGDLNKRGGLHV